MICRVQPQHAPAIHRIIEESHRFSTFPIGPHWSPSETEAECHKGGWVYLSGENAVDAFILYRSVDTLHEITFLATDPRARSRGLMTSLLTHLVESMRIVGSGREAQLPAPEVWLEVHEHNVSARKLYERCGFRMVGRRPRYYSDGGAACLYNYG